ncbi:hypothetical protein ZIOFF_022052 [Zingiber officinale]|uniref:Gag-pol polyprotein n=1 Tax=Zingiber officinale TaxID=94328 RepID=A0A8J5HAX1_ZINOF|nr:hypothetical protein ZIOFF_022052 [Zingiber officinale]
MKALNLMREFKRQQMKENEVVKDFSDRLINLANRIRVLGTDMKDDRIVQKILVSLLERFEATIASLENTKDMPDIRLAELLSALKAQEQRRLMRREVPVEAMEGALPARRSNKFELYGFSDSDWVGSVNEAEFVAATSAVNQAIWLRKLLNDMGHIMEKETKVSVDNQAALAISKNPVFHGYIFLPNASDWFGDAPLEASSDFGINPENGEFHLMCQIGKNCGAVGNRLDKLGERYAICGKEDNRGDPATARDVRINPNPTARDYGVVLSSAMLAAAVEERQRRGAAAEAAEIGAREG